MSQGLFNKCQNRAQLLGYRIAYRGGIYELLSYDCRSIYCVGNLEIIYEFLEEKTNNYAAERGC